MKIKSISVEQFKRFSQFAIDQIPETAKLVVLTGPNGSGKSSLFEAFHFWAQYKRGVSQFDPFYHSKDPQEKNADFFFNKVKIDFHDFTPTSEHKENRSCFYIRSAYRHEADFTFRGFQGSEDILSSSDKLANLISQESRISENYRNIVGEAVGELFNGTEPEKEKIKIVDRLIGEVRHAMQNLFDDLVLSGPGNPMNDGTFRFNKGTTSNFHFKNLSGGEKAAFDLLLDFIVKKQAFTNTIFCIDEPELHMHTQLQSKLLEQLFALVPDKCQLWISTHSIGMARKAAELNKAYSGEVAFIDFHGQEFDQTVVLQPIQPGRNFWKNMFNTALDDLSELVVPSKVIFCEGKPLGSPDKRNPAFDVAVYSQIFTETHPDTDFIPLGGDNDVQKAGKLAGLLLKKLAPGIQTWKVFDRDDRSDKEIEDLLKDKTIVLKKRDLESYLWDNEILDKLAIAKGSPGLGEGLKKEKERLLVLNKEKGNSIDDIKAISGELYTYCRRSLTQGGNNAETFARDTLAPLVTPETAVYQELERIIFTDAENHFNFAHGV